MPVSTQSDADLQTLTLADAETLVGQAFAGVGLSANAAASVARALVAAEAEGQKGHGFSRIADYAAQAKTGKVKVDARPELSQPSPGYAIVDAGNGFAYPALDVAIEQCSKMANANGIAAVSVIGSHHCGALSVQVEKLAQAGLLGLMVANSPPAIAPWGSNAPLFGTNPIAFSAPRAGQAPLVIDLSLSKVARGKVMNAHKMGQDIPLGWALDKEGQPTTSPADALEGTMLPIGDAKGTALVLVVEILAAVLGGANLSRDVSSFFKADGPPPNAGQFLLAIKPQATDVFSARLESLLGMIAQADGARLPGERRLASLQAARQNGLCVPTTYVAQARALAEQG